MALGVKVNKGERCLEMVDKEWRQQNIYIINKNKGREGQGRVDEGRGRECGESRCGGEGLGGEGLGEGATQGKSDDVRTL